MEHSTPTRTQQLLTPLRESITYTPFISGKLQLPDSCFSLFYKLTKDGHAARHTDLANATPEELDRLAQACEPASFDMNLENVLDDTHCKAGKMDSEHFSLMLDPVHTNLIKIVRGYLLEGKGSFSKPHVNPLQRENMFGSLVIVLPTPHEGGALLLKHRDREWIINPDDSGQALPIEGEASISYVAFISDVEYEVAPVTSGHCITLIYNLCFDDSGTFPANGAVLERLTPPQLANQGGIREAFETLLENPEFLADGGTLAFGLRHAYPSEDDLKHISSVLKGSDAVVYQSVRALGYEPVSYAYYWDLFNKQGLIINEFVGLPYGIRSESQELVSILHEAGGILVSREGEVPVMERRPRLLEYGTQERVEWVTPLTYSNPLEDEFLGSYGDPKEASIDCAYGDICLVVRIGKAGDRLAYPTFAELNKEYHRRLEEAEQRREILW